MKIEVKNIQSCMGRNGPGTSFSCSLYIDGKRAAVVRNDGNGGCNCYDWLDRKLEKPFEAWARAEYPDEDFEVADHAIAVLVDAAENDKVLRRSCRTEVLFRLASDPDGTFRATKLRWKGNEDLIRARLQDKHGDNLVEIINEKYA